jgi:hypothetical protein
MELEVANLRRWDHLVTDMTKAVEEIRGRNHVLVGWEEPPELSWTLDELLTELAVQAADARQQLSEIRSRETAGI